jgi:hypothetical protein
MDCQSVHAQHHDKAQTAQRAVVLWTKNPFGPFWEAPQ